MVIAELDRRAHFLQTTFEGHFPGFQVMPRTRDVKVPAIVCDFETKTIDHVQIQRLLKVATDPARLEYANQLVRTVVEYVGGYTLTDTLPNHAARRDVRRDLPEDVYFLYKSHNQLSLNNITKVLQAFEFLPEMLRDRRLAVEMEMVYGELFMTATGRVSFNEIALEDKLARVRKIIDIAMEGLEMLSVGLPKRQDVISVT